MGLQRIFALSFAAVALALILFTGYRSAALFPFLVGVILWVKTGHKIPAAIAAGCVAMVIFIIPVIGVLRSEKYEDIGRKTMSQAVEKSEILNGFRTMGQTAGVLAHVFRLVPANEPYRYGKTYINAFIDAVPNIMPQMAESERVATKRKAFVKPELVSDLRPADWLTYHTNPIRFISGEGVGFSAIGEPYLNFGFMGVIGFFVLLGFALGLLDRIDLRLHPNLIIAAGALYWPLVKTVRNDISNFVKPAVFTLICILIWRVSTKIVFSFRTKTTDL
jgi:oligosaccharide repeat unit polymerase